MAPNYAHSEYIALVIIFSFFTLLSVACFETCIYNYLSWNLSALFVCLV